MFHSSFSGSMDEQLPSEGKNNQPVKDRASTLAPSPNSAPLDSVETSTGRRWSSSSFVQGRATPEAHSTGGFSSTILRYLSRKTTHTSTSATDPEMLEKLRVTSEKLNTIVEENEKLRRLHETQEHELRLKNDQLSSLKTTNDYCRTLLSRNSELELMIAQVQDEYTARINELNQELWKARMSTNEAKVLQLEEERDRLQRDVDFLKANSDKLRQENESLTSQLKGIRKEMAIATSTAEALRGQMETLEGEYNHLRSLHRSQLKAVGDTSKELGALVAENERLSHIVDELKDKALKSSLDFDQQKIELKTQLSNRELDLKSLQSRYDESIARMEELQKRLGDREDGQETVRNMQQMVDNLKSDLVATRVELEAEVQRLATENMVLKKKLTSYEGIHETAQKALQKNSELENSLSYYMQTSKNAEGLREDLRQSKHSQLEAEARSRSMAAEIKILETTITRLTQDLATAQERLASDMTPTRADNGTAIESAMRLAVERCNEERAAHIQNLTDKYERLIGEIRASHKSEMQDLEAQYAHELDTKAKSLDRERQLQILEREQEVAKKFTARMAEAHQQHLREMESYKQEIQREMNQLLDRQRQQWQQRMDAKDEEASKLRAAYEEQLRLLESEKDKEIRSAAIEMDTILAEKEKELTALRAGLSARMSESTPPMRLDLAFEPKVEELRSSYEKHLKEAEAAYNDLKNEHAQKLAALEAEKNQQIEDLRSQLDRAVSKGLTQSVTVTKHFQDSIDRIVSDATQSVGKQLTKLQQDYARVCKELTELETEKAHQERANCQLRNRLERAEEVVNSLQDRVKELSKASQVTFSVDHSSEEITRLVERNRDLEETIATISEKYHDELRKHTEEVVNLQRQLRTANPSVPSPMPKATDSERQLTQSLRDQSAQIAKLEREKVSVERELALRVSEVEALRTRLAADMSDSRVNETLLKKIDTLQSTLAETMRLDEEADKNAKEAAEARASRIRLQGQINMLEQEAQRTRSTIHQLEEELKTLRTMRRTSETSDQVQATLRNLKSERAALMDNCRRLEEELSAKERLVETEMQKRNNQLKALETTNQWYRNELERNDKLAEEVAQAFAELKDRCAIAATPTRSVDVTELQTYISSFQEHLVVRTRTFDSETRRLSSMLREREHEVEKLRQELLTLKTDLERVFARKSESIRLRFESEKEMLSKENEDLRQAASQMKSELHSLRRELLQSENFNQERMDSMIQNLCRQIESHQLLIAQIQDERDVEIGNICSTLEEAEANQNRLRAEIEMVSSALAKKDHEISSLTRAVNDVIAEAEHAVDPTHTHDPKTNDLRKTFKKLMGMVESGQEEARQLMNFVNRMLETQEREIKSVEATRSSIKEMVDNVIGHQGERIGEVSREKLDLDNQLANITQSNQIHQSILSTLKERASIREAELTDLGDRLTNLARSTCGTNLSRAVEVFEHQDAKLAALSAEAKQMSDTASAIQASNRQVTRFTDISCIQTMDTIKETFVKRKLGLNDPEDSTPQPNEDTKRARLN